MIEKCVNCGSSLKGGVCEYCDAGSLPDTTDGYVKNRISVVAFSKKGIVLVRYRNGSVMLPGGTKIKRGLKHDSVLYLRKLVGMRGYNPVKLFEQDGHAFYTSKGKTRHKHHVFYLDTEDMSSAHCRSKGITKVFEWDPSTSVPSYCTPTTQKILSKIQIEYIDPKTCKIKTDKIRK